MGGDKGSQLSLSLSRFSGVARRLPMGISLAGKLDFVRMKKWHVVSCYVNDCFLKLHLLVRRRLRRPAKGDKPGSLNHRTNLMTNHCLLTRSTNIVGLNIESWEHQTVRDVNPPDGSSLNFQRKEGSIMIRKKSLAVVVVGRPSFHFQHLKFTTRTRLLWQTAKQTQCTYT